MTQQPVTTYTRNLFASVRVAEPQQITDKELNEMISSARQEMEEAWKIQSQTTPEEGCTYEQTASATTAALRADSIYRTLCEERESRARIRLGLAAVLNENHGVALTYSQTGPWSVGFFHEGKIQRAAALLDFLKKNEMPYNVSEYTSGVAVTFSRKQFERGYVSHTYSLAGF